MLNTQRVTIRNVNYWKPTTKVVLGVIATFAGFSIYSGIYTTPSTEGWIVIIALIVGGVSLGTHGLFTGIESAVTAGNEATCNDKSTE